MGVGLGAISENEETRPFWLAHAPQQRYQVIYAPHPLMPPAKVTTVEPSPFLTEPAPSVAAPHTLQQRLWDDLTLLAKPRHAQWDPIGLLAVSAFLRERLEALGTLEEHPSSWAAARD
ncbi:MAG: hypothetical protein RLZZ117_434 [Cyanobacteriota bacterium]